MQTAQKKIIQSAEQPTADLHNGVRGPLKQMGYSDPTVPPAEIKPSLTEDLKQLGVDAVQTAGSTFEEVVTGGATNIRETESKKPLSLAWERVKRMARIKSKKAA